MPPVAAPHSVQAVLFDYGLVLSGPPDPAAWAQMRHILGASEQAFHAAYWRPRHDYDRGSLDGLSYWGKVAAELGHTLVGGEREALLMADIALWTQPNQPMIDWALNLQQAGIPTGILSNIGDAMETGILAHCPWLKNFDHHTFSHRLGTAKPDPSIYAHAAEGLHTAPAAILFIDDREDNIEAARAAGMQAIQYIDHAQFLAAMDACGWSSLLHPAPKV